MLDAFKNYVPRKYVTVNDKGPVWMNENIKSKIKTRNLLHKQLYRMADSKMTFGLLKLL